MDDILKLLNENDIVDNYNGSSDVQDCKNEKQNENKSDWENNREEILRGILDDSGINAVSSPFEICPDEKQEFLVGNTTYNLGKVISLYKEGKIEARILRVLTIIVQHRYINIRQIWQIYLLKYNLYIEREKLEKILSKMSNMGIVSGFMFKNPNVKNGYHIYCADYNGIRLYTAINSETIIWKRTDVIQKPYIVKRCLARNQFLISYMKHYDFEYDLQPKLTWSEEDKEMAIIPSIRMTFNNYNLNNVENILFLVEVVRAYAGWQNDYAEKIVRYAQYLKSVEDSQSLKKYYVVVCGESEKHVNQIIKVFYDLKECRRVQEVQNLQIYYTCDLQLLDGRYEGRLLSNLRCYNYSKKEEIWKERKMNFECIEKDWRELEFDVDSISSNNENENKIDRSTDKETLAKNLYNLVNENNCEFPILLSRLAKLMYDNAFNYKALGFSNPKKFIGSLSKYFKITETEKNGAEIDCTEDLLEIIDAELKKTSDDMIFSDVFYNELCDDIKNNEHIESLNNNNLNINSEINGSKSNVELVKEYFSVEGFKHDLYVNELLQKISIPPKSDTMFWVLGKMTNINEISKKGWIKLLAYAYHKECEKNSIIGKQGKVLFDTGFLNEENRRIFLVAERKKLTYDKYKLEYFIVENSEYYNEIMAK